MEEFTAASFPFSMQIKPLTSLSKWSQIIERFSTIVEALYNVAFRRCTQGHSRTQGTITREARIEPTTLL